MTADSIALRPEDVVQGRLVRILSLYLQRGLTVAAAVLTPFMLLVWLLTLRACWENYLSPSAAVEPSSTPSMWQTLLELDLSGFSALILLQLCWYTARNGLHNTFLLPRDPDFLQRAYKRKLFPEIYSGPRKLDHQLSYTGDPGKGDRWQGSEPGTRQRSRPR